MQEMVSTALTCMQEAGGTRVTNVQIVVGTSSHFTAEGVHQHFEVLTAGTPAQGASLAITWLPATYQCFSCQHRFESSEAALSVTCPRCSGTALEAAHHDICYVSSIDIAYDETPTSVPARQERQEGIMTEITADSEQIVTTKAGQHCHVHQ